MTKVVALIGYLLQHSISPAFQQAAFDFYGLDVRYEKWEVEASHLEATINRLRQPSVLGANVTIPYKEAVVSLLDEVDEVARQIGAVNTVVQRDGRLFGYNTDAPGFVRALRHDGEFEPRGKRAVLLGAGGAARAVAFALVKGGISRLTIVNRTLGRAESLASVIEEAAGRCTEIVVLPWEEAESGKAPADCHLLVNCTSVGMRHSPTEGKSPLRAESLPQNALVCDLVYNPIETPLLKEAKKAGSEVLGGLSMLVYQGAASFEMWTDKKAPVDIMLRRARESLE
jgi:shikimate dehydrogenase